MTSASVGSRSTTATSSPTRTALATHGTTGPIEIGFLLTNTSAFAAAGVNVGQSNTDKQIYQALITSINAAGGLGGRRIIPVWATVGGDNWSVDFQTACATFTQDHHVAAVLGYVFITMDAFGQCLAQAGIPHLTGTLQPGDRTTQAQFPTMFSTTNPPIDQGFLTPLQGALAEGRITSTSRLGIIFDTCNHKDRAFNASVAPFLTQRGVTYETFVGTCMGGSNGTDTAKAAQTVQSATLKFRADGVNVVFGFDVVDVYFMMQEAERQAWNPQWLMSDGGAALQAQPGAPQGQLANTHGFGWIPVEDVDLNHQPTPWNRTQQRCLALLKNQGVAPSGFTDYALAFTGCDALFLYTEAVSATGGSTAATQIIGALPRIAASYLAATTYGGTMQVTGAQHGGASRWRSYDWSNSCSCFRYSSADGAIRAT